MGKTQEIKRKWNEEHKEEYGRPDYKSNENGTELANSVPTQQARRALNLYLSNDASGERTSEAGKWLSKEDD
ncbi:unnamed protein product [Urochloa humidicola]